MYEILLGWHGVCHTTFRVPYFGHSLWIKCKSEDMDYWLNRAVKYALIKVHRSEWYSYSITIKEVKGYAIRRN
jgi:hypothetical protein